MEGQDVCAPFASFIHWLNTTAFPCRLKERQESALLLWSHPSMSRLASCLSLSKLSHKKTGRYAVFCILVFSALFPALALPGRLSEGQEDRLSLCLSPCYLLLGSLP